MHSQSNSENTDQKSRSLKKYSFLKLLKCWYPAVCQSSTLLCIQSSDNDRYVTFLNYGICSSDLDNIEQGAIMFINKRNYIA